MADRADPARRLHAAGLRSTRQRRAVLAALAELEHATPEELAARVQDDDPDLNLSTVYRTLDALTRARLVMHVHLHHGSTTYHSTEGEPHIHLVCTSCRSVTQQPVAVADGLRAAAQAVGFQIDVSHLVLHGLCASCAGTLEAAARLDQT
jgi:Fur family transcriptional regulator, ferric uptake regulator